jgi:hypothetical protein
MMGVTGLYFGDAIFRAEGRLKSMSASSPVIPSDHINIFKISNTSDKDPFFCLDPILNQILQRGYLILERD